MNKISAANSVPVSAPISIVAHRGGSALNTENSLRAFAHAIALGVDEVECDVHMMRDGKIVVFHDFDLQQLTGCPGRIDEIDETRRQRLRLAGSDEPPPLLEQLAALLVPVKTRLHIEIKSDGQPAREYEIAAKSLAILRDYHLLDRVSAISFAPLCLAPFVQAGVASGPCVDVPDQMVDWSQQIRDWRDAGYRDVSLDGNHTSPELVRELKQAGFTVGVWTINGPARLEFWLGQKVDYITTDQPDLALELRSRLGLVGA